jgi:hypothetical protein
MAEGEGLAMAGLRTGYPGLTHTAKGIAEFIGPCDIFCEPFAGMGRVSEHIVARKIILNDMSQYAVDMLRGRFPAGIVTQEDFIASIKRHDAPNVTFLFDPPWARKDYADNEKTFCDRGVGDYYKQLREIVPTLQGRWFCAGRFSGGARSTVSVYFSDFEHTLIESKRTINGHPIKTKLYYGCRGGKRYGTESRESCAVSSARHFRSPGGPS